MDETTSAPTSTEAVETVDAAPVESAPVDTDDGMGMGGGMDEGGADEGMGGTEEAPAEEESNDFLGAPEEGYSDDNFNIPEGLELDEGILDGVRDWCSENNVSQKGYQSLIEKMTPVLEQRQAEKIANVKQEFLASWKGDAELGGAKFKQVRAEASKVYEKFVDAETRELLQHTGLNCHPGVVRAFYKISKAISDDAVVRGGRPSSQPSLAAFFNNSKMN